MQEVDTKKWYHPDRRENLEERDEFYKFKRA